MPLSHRRIRFFVRDWMALCIPWLMIVSFSLLHLSEYSRPVSAETYWVVMVFIGCYLIGSFLGRKWTKARVVSHSFYKVRMSSLTVGHVVLSVVNVLVAGYVPLVSAIWTGESDYLSFGLTGVYGFYLAFSNFVGLLAFYNFLVTKQKKYLILVGWVVFVLVMFVTRQNVISLLVEMFVLYMFLKGGLSTSRLLFYIIILLVGFSAIGELRSGDIRTIAKIGNEWIWLPDAMIWLYSYSYFNLLNLDNLVRNVGPSYDGGAFLQLVPNFVKNAFSIGVNREHFLEDVNFTASSAIAALYGDCGFFSIIVIPFTVGLIGQRLLRGWFSRFDVRALFSYCVLYFCALFSFFVNFWFFLPIIFQIVFIYIFVSRKSVGVGSGGDNSRTPVRMQGILHGSNVSSAAASQVGAET